jgi:hypothetical protein
MNQEKDIQIGSFEIPFKRPPPFFPNKNTSPNEGLSIEGLQNDFKELLSTVDTTYEDINKQQCEVGDEEEELGNDEDAPPPILHHLSSQI